MAKVILISPPYMQLSYPTYDIPLALTKGCKYMNPGLLISSSVLDEYNICNKIIKIDDINDNIINNIDDDTILVGISVTCAWEYLEALKIAEIIKKYKKNIKTVLSGWQVKNIKTKVFDDSEYIDYIITGDAEYTIKELFNNIEKCSDIKISSVTKRGKKVNDSIEKVEFRVIDFSKFPNYLEYIPYVEESRNCPFNCTFCLNSCCKDFYQNVPFDIFKQNVDKVEELYGNVEANLLAANFGVNYQETIKKLEYLKSKSLKWNIELHVDNPWDKYIDLLRESGIYKVSIGFESGSLKVLKYMNKTKNPKRYLERLEELLTKLNNQGIKPSLNLLFDYRENIDTIEETINYLNKNKNYIKKVKTNFMFLFEGLFDSIDSTFMTNIIKDEYGDRIHAYPILPSGMSLKDIYHIMSELENGNYDKNILKKIIK